MLGIVAIFVLRSVTLRAPSFFLTFFGRSFSLSPVVPATAGSRSMLLERDLRLCLLDRLLGDVSTFTFLPLLLTIPVVTKLGDLGCTSISMGAVVVITPMPGDVWLA